MVLRRKEMAVQVSIGQHNAPLCHMLATRAGTSLSSSKTAPTIMASGCSAAELNATKNWSGVLQLTESCLTIISKSLCQQWTSKSILVMETIVTSARNVAAALIKRWLWDMRGVTRVTSTCTTVGWLRFAKLWYLGLLKLRNRILIDIKHALERMSFRGWPAWPGSRSCWRRSLRVLGQQHDGKAAQTR